MSIPSSTYSPNNSIPNNIQEPENILEKYIRDNISTIKNESNIQTKNELLFAFHRNLKKEVKRINKEKEQQKIEEKNKEEASRITINRNNSLKQASIFIQMAEEFEKVIQNSPEIKDKFEQNLDKILDKDNNLSIDEFKEELKDTFKEEYKEYLVNNEEYQKTLKENEITKVQEENFLEQKLEEKWKEIEETKLDQDRDDVKQEKDPNKKIKKGEGLGNQITEILDTASQAADVNMASSFVMAIFSGLKKLGEATRRGLNENKGQEYNQNRPRN